MSRGTESVMGIDTAFNQIVDAVHNTMIDKGIRSPVDIQIEFNELGMNKSGILGFGKSNKKQMTITIATRINPEDVLEKK